MNNKQKLVLDEMDETIRYEKKKNDSNVLVVKEDDKASIDKINLLIKQRIADKFEADLKTTEIKQNSPIETAIKEEVIDYINAEKFIFEPKTLKAKVIENFMLSLSGYGILQPLMDDDLIEEIYIYAPNNIRYLKNGKIVKSDIAFENEDKLKSFIDNVLSRINRNVNTANPIEDGRLPDGSRIAVSASVLSPNGYTCNIRKFRKERIHLDTLVELGEIDGKMKALLIAIIQAKLNYVISGGTASGKTTLLNAMAEYIPADENVESVEDNIELQLNRDFWLQLETRKANLEGNGEITMNDLLVHLLRRSPQRIIVGEIRTGAVADTFMNAIQTGHDGTCATVHANNPQRCRSRIAKIASTASGQPYKGALDDFDHSIHLIIQLKKSELLNRRIVTNITYIPEENDEKGNKIKDLMWFDFKEKTFRSIPYEEYPNDIKELFAEWNVDTSAL